MKIADSHSHLYDKQFDKDRKEVIERAIKNGIGIIVVPSEDVETANKALSLSQQYPGLIYASVGYHPHNAKKFNEDALIKALSSNKYVAIGEIGLDWFYDKDTKKEQKYILRKQFELSLRFNLPVILHVRDAFGDIFKIIDEFKGLYGVFHCFSGNKEEAKEALKRGFYISFSGIITYKNARNVQKAAEVVPLEKLLVETDAPYLSPVPKRGKRNEPSFIVHTIKKLSEVIKIPEEMLIEHTYKNALKLFNLPVGITQKIH